MGAMKPGLQGAQAAGEEAKGAPLAVPWGHAMQPAMVAPPKRPYEPSGQETQALAFAPAPLQ